LVVATYNSNTKLDEGTATSITFTPKLLPISYGLLTTVNPTAGARADLTVTLSVTNEVPNNGRVGVLLPKWDSFSGLSMADQLLTVTA
jgi:hypothetical protein